jgi:DNA-binding phage protein
MFAMDVEHFKNHVMVCVERLGGGTKAAHAAKVSNATIYSWIKARRVPNIDHAKLLASLTGMQVNQLRPTR